VSFQAFRVDAVRFCRISPSHNVGRYVTQDNRPSGGERMRTYATKLMYQRGATKDDEVADGYVPSQLHSVGQHRAVTHLTVVGNVSIGHHPIVVAKSSNTNILGSPNVDSAEFPDGIVVADLESSWLAAILLVLGNFANGRKLKNAIVTPNPGVTGNDRVRTDDRAGANLYVLTDQRIRTDLHICSQACARMHNGGRMDHDFLEPSCPIPSHTPKIKLP